MSKSKSSATNSKSQRLLQKFESISIVPSLDVLELEDYAEIEVKYLLGNLLTDEELKQLESFAENTSFDASSVDEEKIVQRFSKFSLISSNVQTRANALTDIINEEKMRSSMDSQKRSNSTNKSLLPINNYKRTIAAFRRIKKRLENVRHFCPSLYYCQNDIFTIWGNMMQYSRPFFKHNREL